VTNGVKNSLYSKKSLAFFLTFGFLKSYQILLGPPFQGGKNGVFSKGWQESSPPFGKGGREGLQSRYFKKLN
jgi:hypothetical protein